MKGFKNTTRTIAGHHSPPFATGGTINRLARGGPIDSIHGMGPKDLGGVKDFHSNEQGHGLLRRQTPMTEELKDAGGTSPLRAGFAGGGKASRHFHVHHHHHAKGGKITTSTKSYVAHEKKAEAFAEGGHVHDSTHPVAPDYARGGKSMRPGGGGRFAKLKGQLARKPGVTNPGAVAAAIGRKKYGAAKMAKFSAQGRHRAPVHKADGGPVHKNAGGALYGGGGATSKMALGGVPMGGTPAMGALGRLAARPAGLPTRGGPPMRRPMGLPGPAPLMRAEGGGVPMRKIAKQEVAKHVRTAPPRGHGVR